MRELKKLLKDLDLVIAKIKDIDCKVKAKVKSAVLTGDKINKVSTKALMSKMPDTPEKTIKCLLNIQKTVVEGLQFKAYNLSVPSVWVDDPEMYEHLKSAKRARAEDTKLPAQLIAPRMAKPAKAAGKEETQEGSLKNKINKFSKKTYLFLRKCRQQTPPNTGPLYPGVMNDISILVLKTQELNPGSQEADPTRQTSPGPANFLKDGLKLVNYSAFCQPTTEDPSKIT
ncbi:hypothetical protein DSO57_1032209 [Entomophthora muscae]|uniref:Uncharacterized protein n=1 Tax=Entomophthora muscae TaxID=34485 RepID=A0ACC2T0J5_9FUNG|nr:hypothetical protein DSO57_1032209 [Entomophthora muscae]